MAKVTDMLNSLNPSSEEYDYFLKNLLSENCDIPLDLEQVNPIEDLIIAAINIKINGRNTRTKGFEYLQQILPRISKETLSKYGTLWITKATQTLESPQNNIPELTTTCKVLATLLINCKGIPELHKQISMQNVKQFINLMSNMKSENRCGAIYYLIAVLLHHYPEVCERSQDSIRQMILPHLDSHQQHLVTGGANCYALLTKATERSFKPPIKFPNYTNWVYNQLLLCNSLHDIMNQLFSDIVELISTNKHELDASEVLDLPEISEDNVLEYYIGSEKRFNNICVYLSTMLRGCGERNSVSPTDILQLLCRGLAVTPFNLKEDGSIKNLILFFMIPKLHMSLLGILSALIEGFKRELIPFSYTILDLLRQTLDWTDKNSRDHETLSQCKQFKNVRTSAYKTLTMWLVQTGSLSGVEKVTEDLLPHIMKEIKVLKNSVLLTVQKTSNLSKKSQKKLRDSQYENSPSLGNNTKDTRDLYLNADLCEEALVVLQNILFSGSSWLNVSFYQEFRDEVVRLLHDLYTEASESNIYKVKINCRLQLLRTLRTLQMNSHPRIPPPTQYSIDIFNMALRDQDFNITQEARLGLAELEKIVHPSAPTLDFPIETKDENKGGDEKKKSNGLVNSQGSNHQSSIFELLDSLRPSDKSEQSKKRASEHGETIASKLQKTEMENGNDGMVVETGQVPENLEDVEKFEKMETETTNKTLSLDAEEEKESEESESLDKDEENLMKLFVE